MPAKKLKEFLDTEKVKYTTCTHSQFFTASEIAASAHIPGKQLAKTVMINVDGDIAMAVLPATDRVDLPLLREITGSARPAWPPSGSSRTCSPIARSAPCPRSGSCTVWRSTWPPA